MGCEPVHSDSVQPETFSQIDAANIRIGSQFRWRTRGKNLPIVNDVGPICYRERIPHVVVGDQNADARGAQIRNNFLNIHDRQRVIPAKGSSSRTNEGESTSDRAISSRRRSPPDST